MRYFLNRVTMRQHLVGAGTNLTQKIKDLTLKIDMSECKDIKKSDRVNSAGRAANVERNHLMIDGSNYNPIYYDQDCTRKSGIKISYMYVMEKSGERDIKNLCVYRWIVLINLYAYFPIKTRKIKKNCLKLSKKWKNIPKKVYIEQFIVYFMYFSMNRYMV